MSESTVLDKESDVLEDIDLLIGLAVFGANCTWEMEVVESCYGVR